VTQSQPTEKNVLVVGGSGFYGRYLVHDLLQFTASNITIASRTPSPEGFPPSRVNTVACDLNDLSHLERILHDYDLIVHCAGPFQYLPLNPLHAAIRTATPYIDIAEDRLFARRVRSLSDEIQSAGIPVMSGISVAPALEALFASLVLPHVDRLTAIRTFAAPDTRKHRGKAMFHTMLIGVGQPFLQPRNGAPAEVHGWTEPEWIHFPPPIGRRLTYLVLEMADLDLLPQLFGVGTVEFKAGTEHVFVNRLLNLLARVRARTGGPRWERFTPLVRAISWLVGRVGKDEGAVLFEIGGVKSNEEVVHRIAVVATRDGGLIPSVLAGIAAKKLLQGQISHKGIVPIHTWITPQELLEELGKRELCVWHQQQNEEEWHPLPRATLS
jgi:saccharopine dehydrogenase-like NADP-dependent oxidoreductase